MSALEFIASLVDSLAWPAAVVLLAVVLRAPLAKLLSRDDLSELTIGPGGIAGKWGQTAAEVRDQLDSRGEMATQLREAAQDSRLADLEAIVSEQPAAAIVEAFARIERALVDRMRSVTGDEPPKIGARALSRVASEAGAITEESAKAIEGLAVLRNLAAHGRGEVSPERGAEFLNLADAVLYALTREP